MRYVRLDDYRHQPLPGTFLEALPEERMIQLHLSLPDPSPRLGADPRYAIRFANHGTWDPDTGLNDLEVAVQVP